MNTPEGAQSRRSAGKICVRCFKLWKMAVEKGEEVPDYAFPEPRSRQKKCGYPSERRSQCVMISVYCVNVYRKKKEEISTDLGSCVLDSPPTNRTRIMMEREAALDGLRAKGQSASGNNRPF